MAKHCITALLIVLSLTISSLPWTHGETHPGSCRIVCDPSTDRSHDRTNGLVVPLSGSAVGPPGPPGPPGKAGPPGLPGPTGKSSITKGGVAFYVALKEDFGKNEVLKFTDVVTNLGGGYDSSTGTFTSKSAGAYYFSFNIVKTGQTLRVDLVLNDETIVASAVAVDVLHTDTASGSAVLQLNAGDRVYIRLHNSDITKKDAQNRFNTFSGYLLYEL